MSTLIKDTKTFYKTLAIALIIFTITLTSIIVLSVQNPLGSDPYFHLQISAYYKQGNYTEAFNYIEAVNKIPFYPPLYHIMLIPIADTDYALTGLRIIEILSLPLTFLFTSYLAWKYSGPKAALITGLILLGGWAFLDGAIQARPQALTMMLYPIMLLTLLATKKKLFAISTILSIYNHGMMAIPTYWGWLPKILKQKTWHKTLIITTLFSLPILALTAYYFSGGWSMWATTAPIENPQETLFWTYPPWIPFYAGLSLIGYLFFIKTIKHNGWKLYIKGKTELETYLSLGLIGNLAMLPMWADRWLQYSTIPCALLIGMEISRWHGKKLYIALSVIALGAWIYICFFLFNSIYSNWWQPEHSLLQGS